MIQDTRQPKNRAGMEIAYLGRELWRKFHNPDEYLEGVAINRIAILRELANNSVAFADRRQELDKELDCVEFFVSEGGLLSDVFAVLKRLCDEDAFDCQAVAMIYGSCIWRSNVERQD